MEEKRKKTMQEVPYKVSNADYEQVPRHAQLIIIGFTSLSRPYAVIRIDAVLTRSISPSAAVVITDAESDSKRTKPKEDVEESSSFVRRKSMQESDADYERVPSPINYHPFTSLSAIVSIDAVSMNNSTSAVRTKGEYGRTLILCWVAANSVKMSHSCWISTPKEYGITGPVAFHVSSVHSVSISFSKSLSAKLSSSSLFG